MDTPPPLRFPARLAIYFFVALFVLQGTLEMVICFPVVGYSVYMLLVEAWTPIVAVVGGLLGVSTDALPYQCSDTTWNYAQLLVAAVLSLGIGLLLARSKLDARRVRDWAIVVLRYLVALTMIYYGLGKVYPGQFGDGFSLIYLLQTYGDSSPQGLMWRFMAFSRPYTIFGGMLEVIAGALLLSRRTTTLGALLTLGVMGNVAALNLSYDVCVKLFSTALVVMAGFILAPEVSRLWNFFVAGREVPKSAPGPTPPPWLARIRRPFKLAFVAMLAYMVWAGLGGSGDRGPLYGVYRVESFAVDGVERPPLLDDELRWRTMTIETARGRHVMGIQQMDGKVRTTRVQHDPEARALTGRFAGEEADKATWHYEQPEPTRMILKGELPEGEVEIVFEQRDLSEFELISRGFHWINDYPYNL